MRGVVDDPFISGCLDAIPERADADIPRGNGRRRGRIALSWFHYGAGESRVELRDDLEWSRGKPVAVGLHRPGPEVTRTLEVPLSPS